jgi:hypothetical protein
VRFALHKQLTVQQHSVLLVHEGIESDRRFLAGARRLHGNAPAAPGRGHLTCGAPCQVVHVFGQAPRDKHAGTMAQRSTLRSLFQDRGRGDQ